MAYSQNFPAQRPVFQFNADAGRVSPNMTFSRSDSPIDATKAAASAVHFWSNEKHLSSENLIINSDASDWYSPNHTTTASQTGPDGGSNATQFTEKANGSQQYKIQSGNFTPIANQEITYSVWLKQTSGSRDYQQIRVGNIGGGRAWATFNLTNGTVDQVNGNLGVTASVNAGPTGWYQCVMRFTPDSTTALSFYIYAAAASGGELPSVTGDTGNSYSLFGAQVSTIGQTTTIETSGQIHREYAPTLKSVATAGAARFEYDPTDGQSEGILIEGQAQNLLPSGATGYNSSNVFNWSRSNTSVTKNAAVAPTGSLEATLIYDNNAATTQHRFDTVVTATAAAHTFSGYFKSAGHDDIVVRVANDGNSYGAQFTFSTQTAANYGTAFSSLSIRSVGNGWYRFVATTPTLASGSTNIFINLLNGSLNYTGDDYSGVLFYGLQFEANAFASSVIATVDAAATRAADSLSVATADIGLTAGQDVTLYAEGDYGDPANKANNRIAAVLQGSSNSYVSLYNASGNAASGYVLDGGTGQAFFQSGVTGGAFKAAISAQNNSFKYAANGTAATEDTAGTVPNYTDLRFGCFSSSGLELDGTLKRVAVYGQSLSSTELAALTS